MAAAQLHTAFKLSAICLCPGHDFVRLLLCGNEGRRAGLYCTKPAGLPPAPPQL